MKFGIPDHARSKHVYIAGKPGQGKSTLLYWMALQDIMRNKAVAVLDPNGDLVELLLEHIPEHRVKDTIYLDGLSPIPLDFMGWQTDLDRDILSDDLITMFRRMSEGDWGPRMDSIFRYAVLSVLEARSPFLDIHRMLTNEEGRREILALVKQPTLLEYFQGGQFPAKNQEAIAPIASRMAKFLLTPALKTALGHPQPKLKVATAIDQNMVLLVNLKKMGQDASNFYGSMIVSQIQQAIWRRGEIKFGNRKPLCLYVDEFQNFGTSTFGKILSEARKFNLGLTLANQHPKQIGELIDDVKGCVSTFILFKMDADHASSLKSAIRPYKPEDIEKLAEFRALYSAFDGNVHLINTPKWDTDPPTGYAHEIRNRTIAQYGVAPSNLRADTISVGKDGKPDDITSQKRKDPSRQPDQRKAPRTSR